MTRDGAGSETQIKYLVDKAANIAFLNGARHEQLSHAAAAEALRVAVSMHLTDGVGLRYICEGLYTELTGRDLSQVIGSGNQVTSEHSVSTGRSEAPKS